MDSPKLRQLDAWKTIDFLIASECEGSRFAFECAITLLVIQYLQSIKIERCAASTGKNLQIAKVETDCE